MIEKFVLTISIAFLISLFIAFAFFVATYGRLPMGGGEVLNWLLAQVAGFLLGGIWQVNSSLI